MNITGGTFPLINIMQPLEYGKAVPNLRKKGIMFLDQLVSPNGTHFRSWPGIAAVTNNQLKKPPNWLELLKCKVLKSFNSLELKAEFQIPADLLPDIPFEIPQLSGRKQEFVALKLTDEKFIVGRIAKKLRNGSALLQHWLPQTTSTVITPDSQMALMIECQGSSNCPYFEQSFIRCIH